MDIETQINKWISKCMEKNIFEFIEAANIFNYSRSLHIRYTVVIRNFNDLLNVYGK